MSTNISCTVVCYRRVRENLHALNIRSSYSKLLWLSVMVISFLSPWPLITIPLQLVETIGADNKGNEMGIFPTVRNKSFYIGRKYKIRCLVDTTLKSPFHLRWILRIRDLSVEEATTNPEGKLVKILITWRRKREPVFRWCRRVIRLVEEAPWHLLKFRKQRWIYSILSQVDSVLIQAARPSIQLNENPWLWRIQELHRTCRLWHRD